MVETLVVGRAIPDPEVVKHVLKYSPQNCVDCGDRIPDERRTAVLGTRLCTVCRETRERGGLKIIATDKCHRALAETPPEEAEAASEN